MVDYDSDEFESRECSRNEVSVCADDNHHRLCPRVGRCLRGPPHERHTVEFEELLRRAESCRCSGREDNCSDER